MVDEPERPALETEKKGFRRDKVVFRTFGAASDEDEDDLPLIKNGKQNVEN